MTDLGLVFSQAPDVPDTFNVLAFGPPGAGKSTGAATAPGPNILWINAEGAGALAYARKVAAAREKIIHELRIEHDTDVQLVLRQVIEHVRSGRDPKPQTIVVDTLGKVREALIRRIVQPGAKNSLQQFGEVARILGEFVRLARDLPVNVVLLAHEDVQDADGERIIRPLIGGALTENVPADMDVVAYCGVDHSGDQPRYLGVFVETRGRRAKDRSGGLGTSRPIDLAEWLAAYRAALIPDSDMPWAEVPEGGEDQDAAEQDAQQQLDADDADAATAA